MYFNPVYSDWVTFTANTQAQLDSQICTWNKPVSSAPRSINKLQGTYNGIVGVALSGAPFYAGLGENGQDPWSPKTGSNLKGTVDECLGDANSANKFYHYPSFSPCIQSNIYKAMPTI